MRRRISIIGLGYVGVVSAACLSKSGHDVIGVDQNPEKVNLINKGCSPIIEKGVPEYIAAAVDKGRLKATHDIKQAVLESDISLICVGTPSRRDGSLDLDAVERVSREIGNALRTKDAGHVVAVRSTVMPGTMRGHIVPLIEKSSGKHNSRGVHICNNPEFLREGTAVHDFFNPPKTVIGGSDDHAIEMVASLYADLKAPLIRTSFETAEMVKFTDNCWHALKVAFANEIGNICKGAGVDSHEVMDAFSRDTKLNISAAYLRPGFAFGGSCLPKDLRALTFKARSLALEVPVLNSILPSNKIQIERALEHILMRGKKRVSFFGFSFKPGTDDLRESPHVELIERLIGKGCELRLYDSNVQLASLHGANRKYIFDVIPHIASLMVESIDEALVHGEVVVVGHDSPEFLSLPTLVREHQTLIDLAHLDGGERLGERYDGVNW